MRKLNNTQTGSAKSADYHIKFMGGQYRVFDKQGRFRVGFATMPAAQAYIDGRSGSRNNAWSHEMFSQENIDAAERTAA